MEPGTAAIDSPFVKSNATYMERLLSLGTCRTYPAGALVYSQGERPDCLFYVRKGTVKITMMHPNGQEKIIALHGHGSLVGDNVLDGFPNFSSAIATERSEIISFPLSVVFKEAQSDPQIYETFLFSALRKLRLCALQIGDMSFRPASDRVIHMLYHLCYVYGVPHQKGKRIQLRITHHELGQITSTSRITVNKVLHDLKDQGIIDLEKRWILVLNEEQLRWMAYAGEGFPRNEAAVPVRPQTARTQTH